MSTAVSDTPKRPHGKGNPQYLIPWKPGQSGNPQGISHARRIANAALREWWTKDGYTRMIELASQRDDLRVASVMLLAITDRVCGKVKETKAEDSEAQPAIDTSKLTDEQKRVLLEVFRSAQTVVGSE